MSKRDRSGKEKKRRKAAKKQQKKAAKNGQDRFDRFGGNYIKLTKKECKNIPGFGNLTKQRLTNDSKIYHHTTKGWILVMDLSGTYFRILNAEERYTDENGETRRPNETQAEFNERSHFRTN